MNIILALIPAIGWGIMPLIADKIKDSKPANQMLGVGIGASLVAILAMFWKKPEADMMVFFLAMLSGACWSIGQIGQFVSFTKIGVSKTMPISTGFQLIGNTIIGVAAFGEWKNGQQYFLGITALVLVIIGVALTAIKEKGDKEKITFKNIIFLFLTAIGFCLYSAFPKVVPDNPQHLFLPQMLGLLVGAILYVLFSKKLVVLKEKATYLNIFAGIAYAIGAFAYIFSAKANGVTGAFIYSQLNVIISTIGGMLILGEKKHGKELIFTLIGLALIVAGAILGGLS